MLRAVATSTAVHRYGSARGRGITQGTRSVLLPADAAAAEPSGSEEHDITVLVLTGWLTVGGLVRLRTSRWRRDGG